jgi:type I restriction enzyme S subunit
MSPALRSGADVLLGRMRSPENAAGEHMTPYLRAANVGDGELLLDDIKTMNFSPAEQVRYALQPGDVLVTEGSGSRSTVGASAAWPGSPSPMMLQNTLLRLRARPHVDPRFLYWWCRHAFASGLFAEASQGLAIWHLGGERVRALPFDAPSREGQRQIADFLDDQVVRLGRAIALRREQLRIMEVAESSILDGFFGDGDRIRPVKSLVSLITSGPRGWGDYITDSGTPFVRIANIPKRGIALLNDNLQYVTAPAGPERQRSHIQRGDVLVSITADLGSTAVVSDEAVDGNVSQHVALLRPIPGRCSPEWLAWAIRSPAAHSALTSSGYGGTKAGLGLGEVGALRVPDAAFSQQVDQAREIAQIMDQASTRARLATRHIDLLEERKRALITAAVTGQFDVTTARSVA